jgi:cobalt-precorrin-5B (C1)-methyltransferase
MTEKQTPKKLRHGYTTGACAAAASAGAARMLVQQSLADEMTIPLPAGFEVTFSLQGQVFSLESALCYVVKDAGDDPDVTNGAEIHSEVTWDETAAPGTVTLMAGAGVGQVTKPGLAVMPGQPAINPVPREMITAAVRHELEQGGVDTAVRVTITVPDGEERASRTLNARLGIIGGLSILGTTGVVTPVSHQAWRDTIEAAMDVAVAVGCRTLVLSGGRTSEKAAEASLALPEEAFVLTGDHVGFALEACACRQMPQVIISTQFAKLVKIAAGHAYTHAHTAELDLSALANWADADGLDEAAIKQLRLAHTAREAFLACASPKQLTGIVAGRALRQLQLLSPEVEIGILLVDYKGKVCAGFGAALSREDIDR